MTPLDVRLERALSHYVVDPETGCWLWTRTKTTNGYGKVTIDCTFWRAHRLSYAAYNGDLEEGKVILHICDTPPCINPAHLRQDTQKANVHDAIAKGRPVGRPRRAA